MILRNRVFRNETVKYRSAILPEGLFADAQASRIHVAKRSDMCSVDMKVLRIADAQE